MIVFLLAPAIANGFPLIFADTGGYLLRPFAHTLELGRSAIYGAFLAAGMQFYFWPNIVLQAILSAWIVVLVLRVNGLRRARWALAVIAALSMLTSLPWYVDLLMPDVFVPLSVLAFYLLTFRRDGLSRFERIGLGTVCAFAVASHMSVLGLMLGLLLAFAVLLLLAQQMWESRPNLFAPSLAVVAGLAFALISNFVIAGSPRLTPGGPSFLFSRLLQDGFVKRYLDRKCPDPTLALCAYRNDLPRVGDDWLWTESALGKLGGWRAFEPEASRIILGSLAQEPASHLVAALKDTIAQMGTLATGEGIDGRTNWHAEMILGRLTPQSLQHYSASLQKRNLFDFAKLNLVQVPVALIATVLLPIIFVWGYFLRMDTALPLTVFLALAINAAICGIFSGVDGRYQSRLVSIAVLAAILGARDLIGTRQNQINSLRAMPQ